MKIIFLGDICATSPLYGIDPRYFRIISDANCIIANFEGVFSERYREDIVYNSLSTIDTLNILKVNSVILGNNHIFDDKKLFNNTVNILNESGVDSFGAGVNLLEAQRPFVADSGDQKALFYSFGWNVIGCKQASANVSGVNPFEIKNLFTTINNYRIRDKHTPVIYLFHWNYELELFPQPMYRQLAKDLIDSGVDAVIGMHPHVAQGAEIYNGKYIVYSLGNWFFPPRKLRSICLRFPEIADRQLALEIKIKSREEITPAFHWFKFIPNKSKILFEKTEDFYGEILNELSPFKTMEQNVYSKWFRRNRRKAFGLPIYYNYNNVLGNKCKDSWVMLRQKLINLLLRFKLKNAPT